jgi:membrane protease YdiL (CAAX protease family)
VWQGSAKIWGQGSMSLAQSEAGRQHSRVWSAFWLFYGVAVLIPILILGYIFTPWFARGYEAILNTDIRVDTNLVTAVRVAMADPTTLLASLPLILQPFAPTLAAIFAAWMVFKAQGVKEMALRFRFWRGVSWRQALITWAQMISLLVGINLVTFLLKGAVLPMIYEGEMVWNARVDSLTWMLPFIILAGLFTDGGGLEEGGWRGYATPLLQPIIGPLLTAIFVGLLWGLWHLPVRVEQLMWLGDHTGIFFVYYALYCSCTIVMSLMYSFFFNRVGGCFIIAISLHSLINDSLSLRGDFQPTGEVNGVHLQTVELAVFGAVLALAGVGVAFLTRGRLGYDPAVAR